MKWLVVIGVLVAAGCSNPSLERIEAIGTKLLEVDSIDDWTSNRNSPIEDVVNIGPRLYSILRSHETPANEVKVTAEYGDYSTGKGQDVTHTLFMTAGDNKLIIRLKYDKEINKFHIVGYTGKIK